MKISANQLKMAADRIKSVVNGYSKSADDLVLDVQFTTADPGSGQMVDTMTLTASGPATDDKEEKVVTLTVEIYPELEKQEPRATKTEQFKLRNSYGS